MRMGEIATRAMKLHGVKSIGVMAAGLLLSVAVPAGASVAINYAPPPIPGHDVMFTVVNESSATNTPPLYGPPQNPAPDDTLSFNNMSGFEASSQDGNPSINFVDGLLNVTVDAKPGFAITSIDLSEFGDYSLGRLLNPTGTASVYPTSPGLHVTITGVNYVPVSGQGVQTAPITYTPTPPYTFTGSDLVDTGTWNGDGHLDLNRFDVTEVKISLDNQLYAASETGTSASISKKGLEITIGSGGVVFSPEPASFATFGLIAIFGALRRRRA